MPKAKETLLTPMAATVAAHEAMQARIVADGLVRLDRDILTLTKQARVLANVWSPAITGEGGLVPLRYFWTEVVHRWRMRWCDNLGAAVVVDFRKPLYVTVTYAGKHNFAYAAMVGAAIETILANAGYTLADYRQNMTLQSLIATGAVKRQ